MTVRSIFFAPSFSAALIGGAILSGGSAFLAPDADAACVQTGATVDCTGNDFNGFLSPQSLTLRIHPGAFIQNIITNNRFGLCPLSFPAIEVGASSSVLNEGVISTGGVCGFGIVADRASSVVNRGTIRTSDVISHGIIADENGTVRNSGFISTMFQGSGGIFGGSGMRIDTDAGSTITTSGQGSTGIEAGAASVVAHAGHIATSGDAALGIDAGPGSSVINSGSIETSANNSMGVRVAGGRVTNRGTIRSVITGPAFALTPAVGVSISGSTAHFTNTESGSIVSTHIGVRLSGIQEADFSNAGRIEASPAIRFDGTMSDGGAAVVVSGSARVHASNSGTIIGRAGLPAFRSVGPTVTLANSGTIVGDIFLGSGSDTIILQSSSSIDGVIDFGSGEDTIVFQNGGILDRAIANVEWLSQNGARPLVFARDITVGQQVLVLNGGGIFVNRGVRINAPATESLGVVRGHGVLDGTLNNGGTVAPGSPSEKGTLTVTGAYRQLASGTLSIRISPDGTSDRLVIGGPASFAGTFAVTHAFNPGGISFDDGQRFDVIVPTGASLSSTGQFTLVAPQSAFLKTTLVTAASGGLMVEIDRLSFATVGVTESQRSVGRLLDRSRQAGPLQDTIADLEGSTAEAATQILAGLAPETPGAVQTLNLMALDRFTELLRTRAPAGLKSGRFAWARGITSSGRSRAAASPADYDLHAAAAGAETGFGRARLGVAAAQFDGNFSRDADLASFDASLFALTAQYGWSNFDLSAAIAYGTGSPELRRARTVNGTAEALSARASTDLWSVSLGGSYATSLGPLALTPHSSLVYGRARLKSFEERQMLAIRTAESTADSLRGRIGAAVSAAAGRVRPYGDLSISVEFLEKQPLIAASLIGAADTAFNLYGEARRRIAVDAEAGFSVALSEGLEAYVAGGMTANDLLAGRRFSAGLTYRW